MVACGALAIGLWSGHKMGERRCVYPIPSLGYRGRIKGGFAFVGFLVFRYVCCGYLPDWVVDGGLGCVRMASEGRHSMGQATRLFVKWEVTPYLIILHYSDEFGGWHGGSSHTIPRNLREDEYPDFAYELASFTAKWEGLRLECVQRG